MTSRDIQFNIIGDASKGTKAVEAFGGKLKQTFSQGGRDASTFGDVFKGSFLGVAGANIVGAVSGQISGLVSEAVVASDATDKFKQTLDFAGLKPGKIAELSKATRTYADQTVYSLGDIQNITAQLATNGVKDYDKLAMASGNLNAIAGGNAETFKSVGMVLTQTAGQGKLTTENWNQLADAIPGASGMIQDALRKNGAFTGNFRDAMAQGQITSEEFNKALLQLGNKPVAQEAAKSTSTFEGALGGLQASAVGVVSDLLTRLKPAFTQILGVISGVVSWVGQNIDWLGPLALGIGIVVGAIGLWTAVQWALNAAMTANPLGIIIVGIGLLIGAIILLVTHWGDVVTFLKGVWAGFIGWYVGILTGFVSWWNGIWSAVANWIVGIWSGIVAKVRHFFMLLGLGLRIIGTGIASWWNGLWSSIGNWIVGIWTGIVSRVKTFFTLVRVGMMVVGNGIRSWWNNLWSGISSFVSGIWSGIVGFVRRGIGFVRDGVRNGLNGIRSIWSNIWNGLTGIVRGVWNGVIGTIQNGVNGAIGIINSMIGAVNSVGGAVGIHIGLIPQVSLPRLATGTVTNGPMAAIIGDNPGGREVVTPFERYVAELRHAAGVGAASQAAKRGPVVLAQQSIDALADRIGAKLYGAIMRGAELTIDTAYGG